MKITRSQKVSGLVLGLALCALVLDRSFGNSAPVAPVTAAAAHFDPDNRLVPALDASAAAPATDNDIASRLKELQGVMGGFPEAGDAFTPSPQWVSTPAKKAPSPSERAIKFQNSHRLRAVFELDGQGRAIVDDSLVLLGQSIDGLCLSSVGDLQAVFTDGEVRAVLHLDDARPAPPAQQDR